MTSFVRNWIRENTRSILRGLTTLFGVAIFFLGPYPHDDDFRVKNQIILKEVTASKNIPKPLKYELVKHLRKADHQTTWEFEWKSIRTNSTQFFGGLIALAGVFAVFIMYWIEVKAAKKKE